MTDFADDPYVRARRDGYRWNGPGARGPEPYRETPTPRDRVLAQSLTEYTTAATGVEVTPEQARAVMWAYLRWKGIEEVADLRRELSEPNCKKLKKAKLAIQRTEALAGLRAAENQLAKFN